MKRGQSLVKRTLKSQKVRFGLVGIANTSVDFVILFIFARVFGVPTLVANMISTSCAVAVSYALNKKTVFKNVDQQGSRLIILFIIVTLAGLWGLQAVVITAVTTVLSGVGNTELTLLIAKVIATVTSLVWNYLWYSRVIFKEKHETKI